MKRVSNPRGVHIDIRRHGQGPDGTKVGVGTSGRRVETPHVSKHRGPLGADLSLSLYVLHPRVPRGFFA